MDIEKAVEQISDIHRHLAKSEIFYGYKPKAVLAVGFTAILTASFQTWVAAPVDDMTFLIQWLVVAGVIIVIMGGNIGYNYLKSGSDFEIQQMSKVFLQFVPSLTGGSIITAVFLAFESAAAAFLPGIWAILFGLGLFSMRPYLPKMIGFVALFYLLTGGVLLMLVRYNLSYSPWGIGFTFGSGHIFAAIILHLNNERTMK